MKTTTFLSLILLCIGCGPAVDKKIKEVPDNIIPSKPCNTLYTSIMGSFPEYANNKKSHAILFSDTVQKSIVITKESPVYITFIAEGASYANSFGWYSYDKNSPPSDTTSFKWNILFPNVSDTKLTTGDMVQVGTGTFKPGTVIGFFLIFNGWQHNTVTYTGPVSFTNYNFNLDQAQQHILFKEKNCGDIVLAFEDLPINKGADLDFNDIIFTVSDNNTQLETQSFDLKSMVVE